MDFFEKIDLLIMCVAILLYVVLSTNQKIEHRQVTTKLFSGLIFGNLLVILLEIAIQAWNGRVDATSREVLFFVSTAQAILIPFATFLIFFYLDYQILQSVKKVLKRLKFFWGIVIVNALVVVTNHLHGLVFTIDKKGLLHLGLWDIVLWGIALLGFVILFADLYFNSNKTDVRKKKFLFLLCLPVLIGVLLQIFFMETFALWAGMTMAILLIHASLQNTLVTIDYLTGVFNRRELDEYVHYMLNKTAIGTASGIFVDIDKFKSINDNYGHLEGDDAIRTVASLIQQCLRKGDFLSRYGGDEFVIIPKTNDPENLRRLIETIRFAVNELNAKALKPYHISLSLGFDVYVGNNKDDFFALLDRHMYEEKRRKHIK